MLNLAQIDQGLLSLTGVIATILSVIFGIAAFYNSRTRRKHLQELERAQKEEHSIHFRPPSSTHPASRSAHPGRSSSPHQTNHGRRGSPAPAAAPRAAPVAKPLEPKEESVEKPHSTPPSKDAPPLFRKVTPSGTSDGDMITEDKDKDDYIWE